MPLKEKYRIRLYYKIYEDEKENNVDCIITNGKQNQKHIISCWVINQKKEKKEGLC